MSRATAFTLSSPFSMATGIPVVMENGEDSVKTVARLIAPDHNLGGVGLVLERYLLQKES